MSAPFDLIVVRHGRTEWNADGRFQGTTDVPLDATGRAQAAALARALAGEAIARVVTSDLARARETARAIASEHGLEPEIDPRFRELNFGAWEGLTWKEIVAKFPALAQPQPAGGGVFATPEGGESFDAACERVAAALDDLRARAHPRGATVVATHAGVLHALLRVALGRSEAQALGVRFVPASITRMRFDAGGASIRALNQTVDAVESPS